MPVGLDVLPPIVPALAGWSSSQLIDAVRQGGKFVVFDYNFSIVIMSFKRSSGLTWVGPGSDGSLRALGWSIISLTLGWWGFPWGIIFTFSSLWTNAKGGEDVTKLVLDQLFGPNACDQILSQRTPPRAGLGLWAFRVFLFLLIGMPIISIAIAVAQH